MTKRRPTALIADDEPLLREALARQLADAWPELEIVAEARKLSTMVQGHQEDVTQALAGARRLTDQGQDLLVLVRQEIGAFTQTSRRIRRKLVRGVDNVEAKLADLETLYDLVHEEVEDTALDVAAALRTSREGNGMLGRVRRMIVPSRR